MKTNNGHGFNLFNEREKIESGLSVTFSSPFSHLFGQCRRIIHIQQHKHIWLHRPFIVLQSFKRNNLAWNCA